MTRHAPLKRYTPLYRYTPVRPRARKRSTRYTVDRAYLAWIHTKPCLVAGLRADSPCGMLLNAHHVGHNGQARTNDFNAVPLCSAHHLEGCGPHAFHKLRFRAFEAFFGVSLDSEIKRLNAEYFEETGRVAA